MDTIISRRGLVAGTVACAGAMALSGASERHANAAEARSSADGEAGSGATGAQAFQPGAYTGVGSGHGGDVTCKVTFSAGAIESVEVTGQSETPSIFAQAQRYVPACIVDGQTLNVEAVSGATMSTNAILDAVADCVAQAGGDAKALRSAAPAPASKELRAGTYSGTAHGHHSDVTVSVTLGGGSIEDVTVTDAGETFNIGDTAVANLPGKIVDAQSIGVDVIAGASFTSRAILGAVADCLEQAGGAEAVRGFSARVHDETPSDEARQVEVDVVVVGSGLAGISAALAAQDAGAKVALLEKLPYTGGVSQTAGGGIVAPNDTSAEEVQAFADAEMRFTCGIMDGEAQDAQYPNRDLVQMLAERITDDLAWLGTKGMRYELVPNLGEAGSGFTSACAILKAGDNDEVVAPNVVGMNEATMVETFVTAGGDVYTQCAASELVVKDGRVCGVKASGAAGSFEFGCRGVVLAAGGFGGNPAMVAQFAPAYIGEENWTLASNTGDGIQMGIDAGGAVYDDGLMMGNHGHAVMTDADMIAPYSDAVTPHEAFYVNPMGLRVNRERPVSYQGGSSYVNPDARDYYWAITNEDVASASDYLDFLEEHLAAGDPHFVKAQTLPELAKAMRMSPNTLRYSLNRYNAFCEAGEDEDYHKDAAELVAMPQDDGPWYAAKMEMAYFGTVGGLVIDTDCAVLDEGGSPIPGLYAAGENANHGFFNICYMGGRSLATCVTCGRVAGTNAAKGE
jgi:uncharacterized protein with FMN-binding domain/succinate dehydrogenase/fumarate reductase flavoprotein subunit